MIVRVRVVFSKTVVGERCFNYLSGSHLQSQVKSRHQMMVFINTLKSDDIYYKDLVTLDSEDDCRSGSRNVSHHARTRLYSHPDDHAKQITDIPGFKSFNNNYNNKSLFSRILNEVSFVTNLNKIKKS